MIDRACGEPPETPRSTALFILYTIAKNTRQESKPDLVQPVAILTETPQLTA